MEAREVKDEMGEKLYFDTLKEARKGFFVEYRPPHGSVQYATLNIIFVFDVDWKSVEATVYHEAKYWFVKFGVPIFTTVFDQSENNVSPNNSDSPHLMIWGIDQSDKLQKTWNLEEFEHHLSLLPPLGDLRKLYPDIGFRTQVEVKAAAMGNAHIRARGNRILKSLMITWLSVIPLLIAAWFAFGPEWLGIIALLYAFGKAVSVASKIWGFSKSTAKEEVKMEIERRKDHYFYHCELNPIGFAELRAKNLGDMMRADLLAEAKALGVDVQTK